MNLRALFLQPIQRLGRLPWLRLWLVFLLTDLTLRSAAPSSTSFDFRVYALSLAASVLFFWFLDAFLRIFGRRVRTAVRWTIGFLLTFLWFASLMVYLQFGDYVTASKLKFVIANVEYFKAFTRGFLLNANALAFLLVWLLLAVLWRGDESPSVSPLIRFGKPVLLLAAYLVLLNQLVFQYKGRTTVIDTSFALAVKQYHAATSIGLYHSPRAPLRTEPAADVNVLLIINESFGKEAYDGTPATAGFMPRLDRWIREDSLHTVFFDRAFTSSGATDVSVPSLLTGVAPFEPSRRLHTMPFVWDWARAYGAQSLFVSAQMFGWGNLREFFRSPGPDVYLTGELMGLPYVNDTGVDELAAVDRFCAVLDSVAHRRRFVAVYGSNALHVPFQQGSPLLAAQPSFPTAYGNAAAVLDAALDRLFARLASSGLLQSTVVIITSDHGDVDNPRTRTVHRIYSFYDEIACIPFIVRVPDGWADRHPEQAASLRANRHRIISNIDIVPTILSVLGPAQEAGNGSLRASLAGRSLFEPVPDGRYTVMLNTNDIRQWEHEGFGIFWNSRRFVYSTMEGGQLFDVAADPHQRNNLWTTASTEDRLVVRSVIDTTFHLKRMYPVRP